jgi:hypothetical protein
MFSANCLLLVSLFSEPVCTFESGIPRADESAHLASSPYS